MDKLTDKFNLIVLELKSRAEERVPLATLERIYEYALGLVGAMDAIGHPSAMAARRNIHPLLVKERNRVFWDNLGEVDTLKAGPCVCGDDDGHKFTENCIPF